MAYRELKIKTATGYDSVGDPRTATKADINSPTFTGTPQAPTPTDGDSSTKIATTEFVGRNGGAAIAPPQIWSPVNGATGVARNVTFSASAFQMLGGSDTHTSSDWQVATDSGFATIVASTTSDATNKVTWSVTNLAVNTVHYVRVRYKTATRTSVWSAPIAFTTAASQLVRVNGLSWYQAGASSPDSYNSLNANGTDGSALTGNTGYTRQGTGNAVTPYPQAMMRRCVLKNDGTGVLYYLDCDNSTKIAGTWSGSAQTGWLRIHEGYNDPVSPIPGQTAGSNAGLRALASAWSSSTTYSRGDLVTSGGKLWVSLSDSNTNITPASGTSAATLDGSAGQVMVEIPRFYVWRAYDSGTKRMAWDIVVDTGEIKPFPTLSSALTSATTRTVDGLTFTVHPAFQKAGVERSHRYFGAFLAYNNAGTLQTRSGVTFTVSQTRSTFRTQARARNTGLSDPSGAANDVWALADMWLWSAIQLLFLTEYRTFYAQAVLGGGNQSGSDYAKTAGRSAALGNASGAFNATPALVTPNATQDDDGAMYRGIEDFYGSSWKFIDGYNGNGNGTTQQAYLSNKPADFADDTSTNYTSQSGVVFPTSSGVYPSSFFDNLNFFPSSASGGSSSTYTTDGIWCTVTSGWYIAFVGGAAGDGSLDGAFALLVNYASSLSSTTVGGVLAR